VDLADLLERLWRRRRAVAAGVALAVFAALIAIFRIEPGVPPRVEARPLETGAGTTQLVLDTRRAPILKAGMPLEGLTNRAAVLTSFVQSPPVVRRISKNLGIPLEDLGTRGAPPVGLSRGREIEADERATELTSEEAPYRVYAASDREAPVITLYTRAPDPRRAAELARAATTALAAYVEDAESRSGVPVMDRVQVRPLGSPQAEWVNRGARYMLAALAFIAAAAAWALVMTAAGRVSRALAAERPRSAPVHEGRAWLPHSSPSP
jgi:hypothetical protein